MRIYYGFHGNEIRGTYWKFVFSLQLFNAISGNSEIKKTFQLV